MGDKSTKFALLMVGKCDRLLYFKMLFFSFDVSI